MTNNVIDLKQKTFKEELIDLIDKHNMGSFVMIAETNETHEVHVRSNGGMDLIALLEVTKHQFVGELLKQKEASNI